MGGRFFREFPDSTSILRDWFAGNPQISASWPLHFPRAARRFQAEQPRTGWGFSKSPKKGRVPRLQVKLAPDSGHLPHKLNCRGHEIPAWESSNCAQEGTRFESLSKIARQPGAFGESHRSYQGVAELKVSWINKEPFVTRSPGPNSLTERCLCSKALPCFRGYLQVCQDSLPRGLKLLGMKNILNKNTTQNQLPTTRHDKFS